MKPTLGKYFFAFTKQNILSSPFLKITWPWKVVSYYNYDTLSAILYKKVFDNWEHAFEIAQRTLIFCLRRVVLIHFLLFDAVVKLLPMTNSCVCLMHFMKLFVSTPMPTMKRQQIFKFLKELSSKRSGDNIRSKARV